MCGKSALVLERPDAASFANLSASSLPLTLLCPDIHLIESLHPDSLAAVRKAVSMCWPDVALGCRVAAIIDWLSVYRDTFFPIVAGVVLISQMANIAPIASASNVLCLSEEPIYAWSDFKGRALPFAYSIAAEPIPFS